MGSGLLDAPSSREFAEEREGGREGERQREREREREMEKKRKVACP